jgi:uncharacterized protein YbjT (DUF2867 family)
MPLQRSALVAGGTGLVGSLCVEWLLADAVYSSVITIVRRPPIFSPPKLDPQVVDFDKLSDFPVRAVDQVFCALGTTIRKAGSQDAFRKVDYEYALKLAGWAVRAGATQFCVVSSVGANSKSSNFYLRVKGEMEDAISALPFQGVHIFRPSFLMGSRAERRPGEAAGIRIARAAQFAMVGSWRRYRPVEAMTVAAAMVSAAQKGTPGKNVYHHDEIVAMAKHYTTTRTSAAELG